MEVVVTVTVLGDGVLTPESAVNDVVVAYDVAVVNDVTVVVVTDVVVLTDVVVVTDVVVMINDSDVIVINDTGSVKMITFVTVAAPGGPSSTRCCPDVLAAFVPPTAPPMTATITAMIRMIIIIRCFSGWQWDDIILPGRC